MNSVFNNNNQPNTVYGNYANGMMYANPVQKEPVWTNALKPEEEKALHKGKGGVSIDIPKEDMWRAKCTHRDPNTKSFTVNPNPDGSVTCYKCGATFNVVQDIDLDQIKKIIGGAIDILQTTKMSYIDMVPEVVQAYFIILPFLEIAPQLYEAAMHTLNTVRPNIGVTGNFVPDNVFNSLYSALGNVGVVNPQMVYPQQIVVPQFMNAPAGQQMVQVPYGANPMQTGYTPTMQMPGVAETVVDPQPAPSQNNQPGKDGNTVNVSRSFALD